MRHHELAAHRQRLAVLALAVLIALGIITVFSTVAAREFVLTAGIAAALVGLSSSLIALGRQVIAGEVRPKSRRYYVTVATGLVLGFVVIPTLALAVCVAEHLPGVVVVLACVVGGCILVYSVFLARGMKRGRYP